jgi:outer membrane protein
MNTDRSVRTTLLGSALGLTLALLMSGCASTVDAESETAPPGPVLEAGHSDIPVTRDEREQLGETAKAWQGQEISGVEEDEDRPAADVRARPRPTVLTVEEVVVEALQANRSVLQARLDSMIGLTSQNESFSRLLPQIFWRGSFTAQDKAQGFIIPGTGAFASSPEEVLQQNFTMEFPIYGFGRWANDYRASRLRAQQMDAVREATESDIAAAVTAAAFDLLTVQRGIAVAFDQERAFERQMRDSQALLDAGRATKDAVLDATVEFEAARRDREKLQSLVPVSRMFLNQLLGRPPHDPIEIVDAPSTAAPTWRAEEIEARALAQRAEIRAARLAVAAADKDVKAAVARELPELRGAVNWFDTDNPFIIDQIWSFQLNLDVPIFTGGARFARMRRARYNAEKTRVQLRDLEDQIRTEVAQTYREVVEQYRDLAVAARSIERAEESLRIQSEKFNQGRATSREVLLATAQQSQTKIAYVRALYAYNIALRDLHRVSGADPRIAPRPPSAEEGGGPTPEVSPDALTPGAKTDLKAPGEKMVEEGDE